MAKNSPALSNFNVGELTPDMAARVDVQKYASGCSSMSRFIPRIQGPARRTPGTRYVATSKETINTGGVLLRPFIFSQGQAYVLEFGVAMVRFYQNHAPVTIGAPSAWSNATNYAQGALVSFGGNNYYAWNSHGLLNGQNLNQTPAFGSAYWYQLTGNIYEVPTNWAPFSSDGTPGIQVEQSADVLYVAAPATPAVLPMTLTRKGHTNWIVQFYWPGDGPFLDENSAASPAVYVVPVSGSPATYDIYSTAPLFSFQDAGGIANNGARGRLIRIDGQYFNIPIWSSGNGIGGPGVYRRYNGNTYVSLNTNGTGPTPPTHTFGVAWDGSSGVQWLYVDSGYGIAEINNFISSTHVQGTATFYAGGASSPAGKQQYLMPTFVQGTTAAITGISKASAAVVTFAAVPSGLAVGDPLYLTGVGGMTQISEQMYTVTAVTATTATINVDSTGFSTFTSGGTGIRNATLNWQLGAWGYSSVQTPGGFPTAVCLWEDRLFWGGGVNGISWWGSAPGAYTSHAQDLYGQVTAACAISGIISSQQVDSITWMSAALVLLIGTKGGEFALSTLAQTEPLGPGNVSVLPQSKFRSRAVRSLLVGTQNFYVQLGGKKVYAQDFNFYLNRYDSTNQNRLANHILGYTVAQGCVDISYHAEPYETLWATRSDGVLVAYTIDRQDDVTGWHEQPMAPSIAGAATVVSCCVIPAPDGTRDELWLAVQRTINSAQVITIEYMEKDYESGDAANSQCYLDCSAKKTGITGTSVTGLTWLAGETVAVLMDGKYQGTFTVSGGGAITLTNAGSNSTLQIGLPYTSSLTTMDIEGGADVGTAQGKLKRPNSLVARLKNAQGVQIAVAPGQPNYPATPTQDLLGNMSYVNQALSLFTGDCARIGLVADSIPNCKLTITCPYPFQCELQGMFPAITVNEPSPG